MPTLAIFQLHRGVKFFYF